MVRAPGGGAFVPAAGFQNDQEEVGVRPFESSEKLVDALGAIGDGEGLALRHQADVETFLIDVDADVADLLGVRDAHVAPSSSTPGLVDTGSPATMLPALATVRAPPSRAGAKTRALLRSRRSPDREGISLSRLLYGRSLRPQPRYKEVDDAEDH